jgi:hypothetical protein
LDAEIKVEIQSNDDFRRMTELATSVPGVGMMLSAQLLVLSQGLRRKLHLQRYFEDKKAQNKLGRLILNNIANKLLKILCAVINSGKKFDAAHISQRPTPKICLTSPS